MSEIPILDDSLLRNILRKAQLNHRVIPQEPVEPPEGPVVACTALNPHLPDEAVCHPVARYDAGLNELVLLLPDERF